MAYRPHVLAVAIGGGKLVPALAEGVAAWPYELLGAAFALLGAVFVAYGYARQRAVERALGEGRYAPPGVLVVAAFTAAGLALGVGVLLVVLLTGR